MKKINEFRIFGPPGTGKTSRLATRDIPRAIEKYGPEQVMVTSFTKAAAREISHKKSRQTGSKITVAPENVGTIHSILYHAFGQPSIMEVHYISEWNEQHPRYGMTGSKVQSVDETCSANRGTSDGDRLLNAVNIKRSRMIPMDTWKTELKSFYNLWCNFKKEVDCMDFTDLIEKGLHEFDHAPNNPKVIFVDEAQDFTKLQLSIIRRWGEYTDWIVLVGDDDQTIFEFTGADPHAFLNPPISSKFKTVLNQSYRIPQTVLQRSLKLIQNVADREQKEYSPRLNENNEIAIGEVRDISYTYNDPKDLLKLVEPYLAKNMDIMFLASCAYMLEPLKQELKKKATPFHNPYRERRGDWNPLHHQDTLKNFLESGIDENYWNVPQFISWAKHLQVGDGTSGLVRNTGNKGIKRLKLAVEEHESGLHTCREVIKSLLAPDAITQAMDRNVDWFIENISKTKKKVLEYPTAVYKKHGIEGLTNTPKIILGTIHSVKGAEADVVVVFPDISYLADQEMFRKHGRDSMYRLFYVAMTRAKRKLILCTPVVMMNLPTPRMYVEL